MIEDWKAGDLAVCIAKSGHSGGIKEGGVYRVAGTCVGTLGPCKGVLGLHLEGHRSASQWGAYAAFGFRKLNDEPDNSELIARIKDCRPTPAKERVG